MAAEHSRRNRCKPFRPSTRCSRLKAYRWPGNIRELRNVVERAVYRWELEEPIARVEFDPFASPHRPQSSSPAPAEPRPLAPSQDPPRHPRRGRGVRGRPLRLQEPRRAVRKELLTKALADARFNQRATAESLGLTYDQLRHALRRHDLIGAGG